MIYCNLKGGLGNMLFQIAAVKSLAIDNQREFSFPNLNSHLGYLTYDNVYNPKLNYAYEYLLYFNKFKSLKTNPPTNGFKTIRYPFEYLDIPLPNDDVFVDGFFQSEKYFVHNRKQILELFEIDNDIKESIKLKYCDLLILKTSAIHVRRGDYVNHPNHHPTQDLEYYLKGMNILKPMTDKFVIFSDDIEWCKENLIGDDIIYIENEKDYIEMYLMSLCDNNIISNSSFSWWGAWLNKYENKMVIGPTKWFGSAIQNNTNDIIPDSWIKI